jgi:hypothetical protein
MIPGIFILSISIISAVLVMRIKGISIISSFGTFFMFSLIYAVFPLLVSTGIQPNIFMNNSLNFRIDLINIHLLVTGLANLAYCLGTLLFLQSGAHRVKTYIPEKQIKGDSNALVVVFIVVSLLVAMAGSKYKWGTDRSELINSIMGQAKVILSGLYAYYLTQKGVNKISLLLLGLMVFTTSIEGSRTTLIAMVIGTLTVSYHDNVINTKKVIAFSLFGFMFFTFIAISRNNLNIFNIGNLIDLIYPLFVEGTYGSYMNLQVYDIFHSLHAYPTYFLNYIIDPIVFFIPRIFFLTFGLEKNSFTIFNTWIASHSGALIEEFSPYGGFFYVAEASAAMPYVGPPIVAFIFAWFTSQIWNKRFKLLRGRMNWIVFMMSFSMVFIKHTFAASMAMYLTCMLGAYLGKLLMPSLGSLHKPTRKT